MHLVAQRPMKSMPKLALLVVATCLIYHTSNVVPSRAGQTVGIP